MASFLLDPTLRPAEPRCSDHPKIDFLRLQALRPADCCHRRHQHRHRVVCFPETEQALRGGFRLEAGGTGLGPALESWGRETVLTSGRPPFPAGLRGRIAVITEHPEDPF